MDSNGCLKFWDVRVGRVFDEVQLDSGTRYFFIFLYTTPVRFTTLTTPLGFFVFEKDLEKIFDTTGLEPTIFRSEVGRHIH